MTFQTTQGLAAWRIVDDSPFVDGRQLDLSLMSPVWKLPVQAAVLKSLQDTNKGLTMCVKIRIRKRIRHASRGEICKVIINLI